MTLLLTAINAKYIHSNLAVYSLQAYAGEMKEHVQIAEFTINNDKDYILKEIYNRKPDVLCFSVYIWNLDYVESVAREFHKLMPQVPIWVGGPEVSYETKTFLEEHPYITGVMIGEGEQTFKEVCACYLQKEAGISAKFKNDRELAGKPGETKVSESISEPGKLMPPQFSTQFSMQLSMQLHDIAGLAYRTEDGCIRFTSPRLPMRMSDIPFAYNTEQDFSNRIIYYESSRGCPFSCSYCLSSVDKHLRFRDTELVKKELQFFIDQKVPQIKFVDRTFNCNHRHAMELWRYIKEHDNGITNFHFEIEADLLNEEELNLISDMRPGLIQLEIGVQSTNDDTIREIHRTMNLESLKKIVARIHAGGNIHQHLDLIAGLPEEGYDSFRRSFDEIYALKPNQLQLGFLKVLKGSYMYDHVKDYGIIYHDKPPYEVLSTNWLSYPEMQKIKRVEDMVEVYYNSGQFEITMKVLEVLFRKKYGCGAFDLFQKLGDFYEEKGYFGMSHSRIRRCEILLEFLEVQTEVNGNQAVRSLIEESLVYDLYYRENCKSRPSWAVDASTFKRETREYCKNGKLSHLEPFHYRFPGKQELNLTEIPARLETPVWILFSYDKRDPLDHQAQTEEIRI